MADYKPTGKTCHPQPTTEGARSFQSAATCAGFHRQAQREAMQRGDFETYHKISQEVPEEYHRAYIVNKNHVGGEMGGSTFQRDDILCPPPVRGKDAPGDLVHTRNEGVGPTRK